MTRHRLLPGMLLVVLAAAAILPVNALAFSTGFTAGATDCAACHGSTTTGSVNVSISGSSTLLPNETGAYTLTIDQALSGGAFNVAIAGGTGTLGSVDPNVQILQSELTHVNAALSTPDGNRGQWVYSFTVTAPGTLNEMITVAAVGMQFNGDFGASDLDLWNSAMPFGITVVPEPRTAVLLGLGLVGLAVSGQGRRR